MKNVLIVDCETTGLDPTKDQVIEVGAIVYSVEHARAHLRDRGRRGGALGRDGLALLNVSTGRTVQRVEAMSAALALLLGFLAGVAATTVRSRSLNPMARHFHALRCAEDGHHWEPDGDELECAWCWARTKQETMA